VTLNRLEQSCVEPTRYHKINHNPVAIKRLLVDLFVEAHDAAPSEIILDLDAQRLESIGETGLEEFRVEPVDHVVERVVGRKATLTGQETTQEIEPLFAPQPDLTKSSMPDNVAHSTSSRISDSGYSTRQRWRRADSAEKWSRTEADGGRWDMVSSVIEDTHEFIIPAMTDELRGLWRVNQALLSS
jgi:hypothetical protein